MKEIILVMDNDPTYAKKFCNQANKLYSKKYNFLTFTSMKQMKTYANENKIIGIVISDAYEESIDDIKQKSIYVLNEKNKKTTKEGKKTYLFKLQNINSILSVIDADLNNRSEKMKSKDDSSCKLYLYFSPSYIKNKYEIVKKIAKAVSKKKKTLVIDLDEFDNYKGSVGLSNIIYEYKENTIDEEKIMHEVVCEKEQEIIKSVTYPEDYNVISNIDLANIINEITKLSYDYVFVNADQSYNRCQYILSDSDALVLMREKGGVKTDKFRTYLKSENQFDMKKVTVLDTDKLDKAYLSAFCKENFS